MPAASDLVGYKIKEVNTLWNSKTPIILIRMLSTYIYLPSKPCRFGGVFA